MAIIEVIVRIDDREERAMARFLRALAGGEALPLSWGRYDVKARQRCRRWDFASYGGRSRGWEITEAGRRWLLQFDLPGEALPG